MACGAMSGEQASTVRVVINLWILVVFTAIGEFETSGHARSGHSFRSSTGIHFHLPWLRGIDRQSLRLELVAFGFLARQGGSLLRAKRKLTASGLQKNLGIR